MDPRTFEVQSAKFIERCHEQIRENFIEDAFHKREILSQYQLGREILEEVAGRILAGFTKNIDGETTREIIADEYLHLGVHCYDDGLSYAAMGRVFILLKRHIWLFFQDSNFAGQPFDVRSIIALNNRTALFFRPGDPLLPPGVRTGEC